MVAGAQQTVTVGRQVRVAWLVILVMMVASQLGLTRSAFAESLDQEIDRLKADVADLSQTLYQLEENVLYPVDTQVAVFLTLRNREGLDLDSVELYLNDTPVASHLYTDQERDALKQGGVQRLAQRAQQFVEALTALHVTQTFRIRRRNVDRDVVGDRINRV